MDMIITITDPDGTIVTIYETSNQLLIDAVEQALTPPKEDPLKKAIKILRTKVTSDPDTHVGDAIKEIESVLWSEDTGLCINANDDGYCNCPDC